MWTRLDNLRKENAIEEMATYSFGRARIVHVKRPNPSLREFWIKHLRNVLRKLGFIDEPYVFQAPTEINYQIPSEVRYAYVKKEEGYPYGT
jgi:hypothetical protein